MRTSSTWRVALALLLVLPLAGACKKKGPRPGEGGAGGAGGAGLGEEGLGASGSSLERSKRGLPPEEDGILKDVHFGYDSYELDGTARDALTRNLDWLRQNSRAKIELEGHCDSRGTDRKSTRLNSSHGYISYAVFCLKKKKQRKHSLTYRNCEKSNH